MNILFVCTGNTCRSSMAEGLLKHFAAENPSLKLNVKSAGTAAFNNQRASENAVLALQKLGIDITSHKAQTVTKELIKQADLVLAMTKSHKSQLLAFSPDAANKIFTLSEFTSKDNIGDISDPFGGNLDTYVKCRDEISAHIMKLLNILDGLKGDD